MFCCCVLILSKRSKCKREELVIAQKTPIVTCLQMAKRHLGHYEDCAVVHPLQLKNCLLFKLMCK